MSEIDYRQSLVNRVLEIPAAICPEIFHDFTLRGQDRGKVDWDSTMLSDKGVPLQTLRDLCVMLENKAEAMGLTVKV